MPKGIYIRTEKTKRKLSLFIKNKIKLGLWKSPNPKKYFTEKEIKKAKVKKWKKYYYKNIGKYRLWRKIHKYLKKKAGKLSIRIIQMVYEDNIKKYGTLTCYLCLKPIEFGKDTLEHKTPLSRSGTNEYNNLAVACNVCNSKKHNKTYEEFTHLVS